MSKLQLIYTKGLPASGKTKFSREWVNEAPTERVRINRDDIRRMIGPYWVPSREDLVTMMEDYLISVAIEDEYSVIVDATNFKGGQRFKTILESCINGHNVEIIIKDFTDTPLEVCLERDKNRSKEEQVGEEVIRNFYNKYLKK